MPASSSGSLPSHPSSILVDVSMPDPPPVPPPLLDLLGSLRVVLVGWFHVPEQTAPEQARDQFGEEAAASLQRVAQSFQDAGAEVTSRLVFTGNKLDTLSRISAEESCDAVYLAGPVDTLKHILVPLRGRPNLNTLAPFVADLVKDDTARVTLMHVLEDAEEEANVRETVLVPFRERVEALDIDAGLIVTDVTEADDPAEAIIRRSAEFDVVVLGESEPTIREILFGTVPERIATEAETPVIVVRHAEDDAG